MAGSGWKRSGTVLAMVLCSASAFAADKPCLANYTQAGNFMQGRQFGSFDEVAVAPAVAYKKIYAEGIKSGLKVANSDSAMGALSFEQVTQLDGRQVTLPWNVLVEAAGTGSKITVSKTTPPGYATSKEFQQNTMCSVIEAASK